LNIKIFEIIKNAESFKSIPRESISSILIELAAIQNALAARLLECADDVPTNNSDKLLEVKEAAEKLSVTEDWLYRKGNKLPFVVHMGRNLRFSEQGIEKYIRQRLRQ
jgi:predicted DNA-binding transcriptional regulator AlpA